MSKQNILILISVTYIITVCAFFSQAEILFCSLLFLLLTIFTLLKKLPVNVYLACLFIILTAYINCSLRIKDHDDLVSYAPSNATITARVLSIPTTNNSDRTKFYTKVKTIVVDGEEKDNINAKTLVSVYGDKSDFSKIQIGDTLKLSGRLNSATSAQNPYQFNYAKYLKSKDTFTLFYSKDNNYQILSHADTLGWKFLSKLNTQRTKIIDKHAKNIKSPNLEILGGIIFGDDAVNPTDEIRQNFINSGLLHILAASGMNVTLIFGIWFFLSQRLRLNYRFSILTGMGIIIFYTCMTGFGASILRATIMLLFILLGKLLDRTTDTLALLFLVALLMLLYNPSMINDVGFQLSFIVTFGLLFTTPVFNNKISNKFLNICFVSALVPLVAQLYAAPLQMYYFNTLSIYSVLANILIIPVLSIVSFLGFVSSILAGFEYIAPYVCKISSFVLNPFISWIVIVADFFSKMPYSTINIYKFGAHSLVLYYTLLISATIFFINKTFELRHKIFLTVLALLFVSTFISIPNKDTEIIFFSVGNADSALIKSPDNKYFLIDTGRLPYQSINSSGKQIILKYLRGKTIKELHSLTLTHFDADHAGGAVDILSGFPVSLVYMIENEEDTNIAENISDYIKEHSIDTKIVKDREILHETENFRLTNFVNPNAESENDHSIMTLLEANDKRAVFMGDCRAKMIDIIPFEEFDIIKIGHHGADGTTTPEMISKTKSAIISTGFNQYGHPRKETLDNLKDTFYMRTDNNNAIKVVIKKDKTEFYSYYPHKNKFVKVKELK
ncbi:DNA internalization-related competence protein ComEC/Rec2 [bacterium]|nr:DNA internalization-related competence protein ComEC/Rec2 [bacterium]